MLHHEALATSLTYLSNYYENKPGTRVLGFSSFTFDGERSPSFISSLGLFQFDCHFNSPQICLEMARLTARSSAASVADIFTALFSGSTICLPSDHSRLNSLPTAMNRLCAETALLTPSVASLITPSDVPTLKTLLISGESATRALIDTWAAKVSLKNCCKFQSFPRITDNLDDIILTTLVCRRSNRMFNHSSRDNSSDFKL